MSTYFVLMLFFIPNQHANGLVGAFLKYRKRKHGIRGNFSWIKLSHSMQIKIVTKKERVNCFLKHIYDIVLQRIMYINVFLLVYCFMNVFSFLSVSG